MIVADTSAWIDYVGGIDAPHTDTLDQELEKSRIITGDLIIAEFLQGFRHEEDFEEARRMIESLEYHDFDGKQIAIQAAQNFRTLTRHGVAPRKTIDVIIATFCVENGYELIHNDRDFDPMQRVLGLQVRRQQSARRLGGSTWMRQGDAICHVCRICRYGSRPATCC